MCATKDTYIRSPNFWPGKMEGSISPLLDDKIGFCVAHDKRYEIFVSSEEDNNSCKLKCKEIICVWENSDFVIGEIERIASNPGRGKNAHP